MSEQFNIRSYVELDASNRAICPLCTRDKGEGFNKRNLSVREDGAYYCHRCSQIYGDDFTFELRLALGVPKRSPNSIVSTRPLSKEKLLTQSSEDAKSKNVDSTVSAEQIRKDYERLQRSKGKAIEWLKHRGITPQIIDYYQLGMKSVKRGPEKQTYWGISIPIPANNGTYYRKSRVAPWITGSDRPEYVGDWDQPGISKQVFFAWNPPGAEQTFLCEGEWDAMRLGWQLINHEQGEKIAVASFTCGCSSIPDQPELLRLPGQVVIFYDLNDVPGKNGYKPGEEGAKKVAIAIGERALIGKVPQRKEDADIQGWDISDALNNGFTADDIIEAAINAEKYRKLALDNENRQEFEKLDFSFPEAEEIFTQKATAALFGDTKWISLNEHLHRWNGTHYELVADATIRARIAHWCASTPVQHKDKRQYDYAKSSYVENIWNWVHLAFAVDPALINPPGINCLNGTVRLHWKGKKVTWSLEPHSPDELYIYTNKINYDPKADGTQCDRLLACLELDQQDIFLKTLAASLDLATVRKYLSRIKSIFNQGDGNNGKDATREAASYLYGSSMTAATISDFQSYDAGKKFPLAKLENSLINWSSENASFKSIDGLQSLKVAISGEQLDMERKNQDERPMFLNTVFFFNINEAPNLQAGLEAIQSRWAVLSFNKTYKVGADASKGELEADSRFRYDPEFLQSEVVPALLNRVLEALPRLMEEGIDYSCTQKALESIQQKTNHLWAFASEVGLGYSKGGRVYINELWEKLKDWYIANGTLEIVKNSKGEEKPEWHDPVSNKDKNIRGANQIYQRFAVLFPKISRQIETQIVNRKGQAYLEGIAVSEAVGEASEAVGEPVGEATERSQSGGEPGEPVESTLLQLLRQIERIEPLELRKIMLKIKNGSDVGLTASLDSLTLIARAVASPTGSLTASLASPTASPERDQVMYADQSNPQKSTPIQAATVKQNTIHSGDATSNFFTPAPSCFNVGDRVAHVDPNNLSHNWHGTILEINELSAKVHWDERKGIRGGQVLKHKLAELRHINGKS